MPEPASLTPVVRRLTAGGDSQGKTRSLWAASAGAATVSPSMASPLLTIGLARAAASQPSR